MATTGNLATFEVHGDDDIEKGRRVHESKELSSMCKDEESHGETHVAVEQKSTNQWQSPHDWPQHRKITIAVLVSFAQLVTLMSASVMAAALPLIAEDLNMSASTTQIAFSVYFLGLAVGPLPIAAFSEYYGRKPVWICCNLWYCLWNSLCPVANSEGLMIAGRFLAGSGASVGITLSGPIVADMYGPAERGTSLAVATFAPYFGTALGPIIGGLMAEHTSWHWLFWTISIFDATLVLVALPFLHETYGPVLQHKWGLRRSKSEQACVTNDDPSRLSSIRGPTLNLGRPILLLLSRPIAQVLAFLLALNFGTYCITLSTFAVLWIDQYHQSALSSSLHYIAIAAGATIATQVGGRLTDYIWRRLLVRANGVATPEFRVPMMVIGAVLMPLGMLWYGWTAQGKVSWFVVDIGVAIFSVGSFVWSQAVLAYLLDEFVQHAASANAASRVLSNVLGFAFPIFAPQLYRSCGYGWGNTLLAGILVVLGWPPTFLLWSLGARLRKEGS